MITGFNTDIVFDGKTYHVQTEDKGTARPMILSLVYDRGTILASKRTPYEDLMAVGFDENVLADRLQKQHRLICAAVKNGRLDDLIKMSAGERARKAQPEVALSGVGNAPIPELPAPPVLEEEQKPIAADDLLDFGGAIPMPGAVPAIPMPMNGDSFDDLDDEIETLFEDFTIIEEGESIILPDEAVEIVSEIAGKERPANTKLSIEFLGDARFRGGERKSVGFMVTRGSDRKVVGDAQIMVKILGSSFRPLIFHAKTDKNGIAKVNLQVPNFTEGRAAFLVRAIADGEEVELRRTIAHG